MDPSPELDVIYRYSCMAAKASSLGYHLLASRTDFVLRRARDSQAFAFCPTLQEVGKQLTNLILLRNLKRDSA